MFGPSQFFSVLWPLLTSCSSLLLRIFFRIRLLDASARPPRVLTHSFPLYLPYLPQSIPCSYWTLTYVGVLSSAGALYMVSVRQARVLPPSFFRFCLTTDTLDLGYILPTAGRIRDFHPLERALTGRTTKGRYGFLSDSITALLHLHIHSFFLVGGCDIHIISDNAQGGIVALTLGDSVVHLNCLLLHPILPQRF